MSLILSLFVTLLALCTHQALSETCTVVKNSGYYLSASNQEIIDASMNGNKIGGCFIQDNRGKAGFCDLYAKSALKGVNGDAGWPKTTSNRGTGCVRAPDLPKGVTTCFYQSSSYDLSTSLVDSFCTNNGFANAVEQIKHAIRNNACALPDSPAPVSCSKGERGCVCTDGLNDCLDDCRTELRLCRRTCSSKF